MTAGRSASLCVSNPLLTLASLHPKQMAELKHRTGLHTLPRPPLSSPMLSVLMVAPLPSSRERKLLLPAPLQLFRLHLCCSLCPRPRMPSHLWLPFSPRSCWAGPHPRPLTRTCPSCSGCSVSHAPPALFPRRPFPFQKLRGGVGGAGAS